MGMIFDTRQENPGTVLALGQHGKLEDRDGWDNIKIDVVRNFIPGTNPTNMQLDDIYCLPEVCK